MKATILFFFCAVSIFVQAQHMSMPNYSYTPKPDMSFSNFMAMNAMFNNYRYYGTISQKHKFKVLMKDSSTLELVAKIDADSLSRYLVYTDRSVKRSDSGRTKRIYPSQTISISRLDQYGTPEITGIAADSCWLFPVIRGQLISAYAALAEDEIDDGILLYFQEKDGPLIRLTDDNLESAIKSNEKAEKLLKKKKYSRAINKFNSALEKEQPAPAGASGT